MGKLFHESRGEVSPRQRDCKRNVHDVALIGSSARILIVQKMTQALHGVIGLAFNAHRNSFANELGRRNLFTGEVWKDKPPFRLAMYKATSDDIAWQSKAWHWKLHGSGAALAEGMGGPRFEDDGFD